MTTRLYFTIFLSVCLISCKERSFRVPSASMEGTILPGDQIEVVEATTFKNNDVVVYRILDDDYTSPPDDEGIWKKKLQHFVSRLIASSGDIVQLKNGELYRIEAPILMPINGKTTFKITCSEPMQDLETITMHEPLAYDTFVYFANLTSAEATALKNKTEIVYSIQKYFEPFSDNKAFAKLNDSLNWNKDNYGPLKIPDVGDNIEITDQNFQNLPTYTRRQNWKIYTPGKTLFRIGR